MARKSRKDLVDIDNKNDLSISKTKEKKVFKTAIYTRLSAENSGKSEDMEVMKNQVAYCKDYIKDKSDLKLIDIYVDDGYTGTNFNRPEFNRLMEDIRANIIDTIVIRDLSRMGRNYIELGVYLERLFPSLNVRLISINDNYDNFSEDKSNEALMIPLQNMINDFYSKDISRKIHSSLRVQKENGTYKHRRLPYGYMWNEDRSQIVVDEEVASYIQMIFKWKIDGVSHSKIVGKLKELNAPNPKYRKNELGVCKMKSNDPLYWSKETITNILKNEIYVGTMIFGKSYTAKYKGIEKPIYTNEDEKFVFENYHKEIVSKEEFDKVQEILKESSEIYNSKIKKNEKLNSKYINIFNNKIYCGDCGKKMFYKKQKYFDKTEKTKKCSPVYNCQSNTKNLNDTCSPHHITEKKLQEKVLNAIKLQIKVGLDYEKLLIKLKNSDGENNVKEKQQKAISSLKLRISSVQKKRARLYEDFINGLLDESEYRFAKVSFDEEYKNLNGMLEEMINRQISFNESMNANNKWIKLVKSVSKTKKLTQSVVDNVIEEVRIYEGKRIEVVMKYDDIYRLMVESVEEVLEEENV